jgi:hypothetical protein
MKPVPRYLKYAVVVSSVVLVAGFVSYRAGAWTWIIGDMQNEGLMPSSKSGKIGVVPKSNPPEGKSSSTEQPDSATQPDLNIMSGSKSFVPLIKAPAPGTPSEKSPPSKPAP